MLVCQQLRAQGWQIVAQQWRCRWGEIDIIARGERVLAFIEVKTRQSGSWDQEGRLAVDRRKQRKLIRTAAEFLQRFPSLADLECRFDVALVEHRSGPAHSTSGIQDQSQVMVLDYIVEAFEVEGG